MAEQETLPVNQKGYISPIVPTIDTNSTIASSIVDPYALISSRLKTANPTQPNEFNTIDANQVPNDGRYSKFYSGMDNENLYHNMQSGWDRIGNSAVNFVSKFGSYLTQTAGFLGGAIPAAIGGIANDTNKLFGGDGRVVNDGNAVSDMTDNWLVNFADAWKDKTQEEFPIYKGDKYTKGNIWQKLGSTDWWLDDFVDRLALTGATIVPGFLEAKGVGLFGTAVKDGVLEATGVGAKAIKALADNPELYGKIGKVLGNAVYKSAATGVSDLTGSVALNFQNVMKTAQYAEIMGFNTVGQNALNGRESQVAIRKALIEQNEKGLTNYTPEEIDQKAAEGAMKGFWYNMPLTLLSSAWELPQVFSSMRGSQNMLKKLGTVNNFEEIEQGLAGITAKSANPGWLKTTGKALFTGFEHGQLESSQVAIGRAIENTIAGKIEDGKVVKENNNIFASSYKEYLNNFSDPNGQNNIALGTIQGIFTTLFGHGKSLYNGEYTAQDESTKSFVNTINSAIASRRFFSSPDNMLAKDENGKPIITDGKPQFNQQVLSQLGLSLIDAQKKYEDRIAAVKAGDKTSVEMMNHQSLAALARDFFPDAGGMDYLKSVLEFEAKTQKNNSDRQNDYINSIEVTPDIQLQRNLEYVSNLKKAYNAIEQRHAGFLNLDINHDTPNETSLSQMFTANYANDIADHYQTGLKDAQYLNSANQIFLSSKIQRNETELASLGISEKVHIPTSPQEERANEIISENEELNKGLSLRKEEYKRLINRDEINKGWEDFKKQYTTDALNNITKAKENVNNPEPQQTTVKIKTKTGEKDYEVGTEYMLGKVVEHDKNGNEIYRFPKLTILGENKDGTIRIKDSNGNERDISKSVLEDYKLSKVSDVQGNSTTRYYAAHINDIFQYNFGKDFGGRKRGRLTYDNGKLYFTYKDDKGEIQNKELNRSHFEAQGKFTDPRIKIVGGLEKATVEQKAAREAFLSPEEKQKEKDAQTLAEKNDARLQLMKELHDQTQDRLDTTKKLITDKTKELEKINKEIDELKAKSEKTALPRTKKEKALESKYPEMSASYVRFSKILKTVPQGISKLVTAKEDIEYEINALKAQQEELEFNLSYMEDFSQNISEMPENSTQFIKDLNENVEWTKELIKETASNLSTLSKIYTKIQDGIKDLTSFLKSLFTKFDKDYPSYLKDGFDRMISGGGILSEIKQVKEYIADYTLTQDVQKEISIDNDKLAEIEKQTKELYDDMVQLGKELSAKQAILDKFQVVANEYKAREAEKNRLQNDVDLRAKFFKTTQSLEKSDNEVNDTDTEENKDELRKIDIADITKASTEPMYDKTSEHNDAHIRHQEFLLNISTKPELRKLHEDGKIKILPVTAKTEKGLGLKGIINPDFKDTSIRYVYVIDDSNGTLAYIDKEGNSIPATKEVDLNKIIFTNARETDLSYLDKNGVRQPSYTNKLKLTDEELEQAEQLWENKRNIMLNANITPENALGNTLDFYVSRGIPNVVNGSSRNSILDIGIINEEDLVNPVITLPAFKGSKFMEVAINNSPLKVNMPVGKPLFNYNGNMFFLNNRNFTDKEASSISELLVEAGKQLMKSGEIEPKLQTYLESVIRFSDKTGRNIIHFDKNFNLFMGDNGKSIPISDLENSKDAIAMLLEKEVYHHINLQNLNKFKENPSNTPFTELKSENGKVTEVEHKSYQHYLLLGKEPVLSTNIAIPQKGELPIIQKYAILDFNDIDVAGIVSNRPPSEEVQKKTEEAPIIEAPKSEIDLLVDELNSNLNTEQSKVTEGSQIELIPEVNDLINELNNNLHKPRKKFGNDNYTESQTRLEGNAFTFTGDKVKELEDIKKMLPNVDIHMLKNMYQTTGGLKAWGYALPKIIALYEGAPFGVGYHEAFEQVFNWVLTPKQQLELYKEFRERNGSFKTFNGEYKTFNSASFAEAKEQIADEFAEFKATGKIPFPKKNTSSFFKRLWELIKSIFNNNTSIEGVFNKLSEGEYANSTIRVQGNTEKQFKRDVVGVPEALFQDTINGFTSELFMKKWSEDSSLIAQLEDNTLEDTKPLFDQLYAGLQRFYTEQGDNTLDAYYGNLVKKNPDMEDIYIDEYEQVQHLWDNVSKQWGNYMSDLKRFLKTFDIAFVSNENGEIELASELKDEYEKLGGSDSYASEDRLQVSARNSASRAVKLLFATVADSSFVKESTRNELQKITERYTGEIATNRAENQMKLPNLAPYAKLFNYTLHNSANFNGIQNIYTNLRTIAAKRNIGINANLTRLLNRLGYNGSFAGMSKGSVKMILKMENTLSKNKPKFFKQYMHPKEGLINQASNISDRAEQIADEWINSMMASKFVQANKNQIKFKSSVINKDNFIFLSNLGIKFTPADYEILSKEAKNEFNTQISYIKAEIGKFTNSYVPISGEFGFSTRLAKLAELYTDNIEGDFTEAQHPNLDGEAYPNFILPNYVSYILNDLNIAKTKAEFLEMNPQYQDLYMGSSYLLNEVFFDKNGNRTKYKINTALAEGIYTSKGDKIPHDKMSYASRLLNEINNNIKKEGLYTALVPADAKTPWGLTLGNHLPKSFFVDKEKALAPYMDTMWDSLLNEVALAKDYENRKHLIQLTDGKKQVGREVGKSLRFFKGVLSPALVERINNKLIDGKEELSKEELDKFKVRFIEDLTKFIEKQADKTITNLTGYRLIDKNKQGNYQIFGIDKDFSKSIKLSKYTTEEKLKDIFFFREANYILNNIELHKLLFNDPAQYKDEIKRIKSFLSGRDYTHSDKKSDLNDWLNKNYNVSGDYQMKPGDWGYKTHNNFFNSITIKTVKIPSENDYSHKQYKENDIADAQSWVLDTTYMEQLIKSGGRPTSQQEKLHEWLMAYTRQQGLIKGKIKDSEYPVALINADNAIIKTEIPDDIVQIIKPIISGTRLDENGVANQFLYKTSSAPMYLYFVEDTPMEEVYWDAVKNNVHFIAMDSAHKVGQTEKNTINWGDKFTPDMSVPIDYKYFGIQVETGGTKSYQTQGSQLTKLATSGLLNNGTPISEEAGKLVERHRNALINLTLERSKKLLNSLDIKKGEFGYTIEDKTKIAKFILDEITRRELPDNMGIGIEVNEDKQFTSPLEANVNYKKIKEILYSTIENNILKPKVNGGPKILLSSLGYDTVNVNGKEVGVNRKYKFYQEKNGKYTCQIGIPFMFKTKILAQIEKSQGIKFDSQKQGFKHVLDYLNTTEDGQNLLRGIGFRIPTQGLNSVDHFEIVEFLPPQMGDCVIFPAEITTKAGSDFDVDKMSIYLKNHYIDENGYPKLIPANQSREFLDDMVNKFEDKKSLIEALLSDNRTSNDTAETYDFSKEEDYLTELRIKSLENEYFNTLGDILSLKETRQLLLQPNDAKQLKDISAIVSPETESFGDYTNFIDSDYMFKKRQLFLAMKAAVGIAAVSNTNLALNQYTNLIITPKITDWVNQISRNFKLRFPHNNVGKNGISLSNLKNASGDFISDLGSQIIDGTVDVAKSEWLPKMLGDANNLSIILFMYKAGVDPYSAALFLNQPGIKEYIKQLDISNNSSLFNPNVKKQFGGNIKNKLIKDAGISKSQMSKFFKTKPDIYTKTMMESYLNIPYESLNKEEKYLQMQILDDFFMTKQLAGDLFTIVNGYNFDTSRFQNPETVDEKQLDLQQSLELSNVTGQKDLLTKTHIGTIVKSVIDASDGISSALAIEKGEAKRISNQFGLNIRTQFFKRDDRVKFRQMGKHSLVDFIINTQAKIHEMPVEKLSASEFLGSSISNWVKAAQVKPSLANNPMLQNIEAVIDQREGYNSYLKLKEMDYDTFTSNIWTPALRELRDSGEIIQLNGKTRTVGNLFQHMMITQFLQNGTSKTRNSFLHLIPAEEFSKIVSPVLENINGDLNFWLNEGLMYRNNYQNSNLVTEAPKTYYEKTDDNDIVIESGYKLNKFKSDVLKEKLDAAGYNSDIVALPAFGNSNKQFIKSTEYKYDDEGNIIDKTIDLYKRVDKSQNEYLTEGEGYDKQVLFKKVNKLGNDNLKEYYSTSVKSILAENENVNEVPDSELYNFLREANLNIQSEKLTELLSSDEYDLSLESEDNKSVNLKPGKC